MFGVPLEGPTSVFCDNNGVVKNASIPESALAKKHNVINYHAMREAAAAGILRVGKEDGQTNLADLLTKVLRQDKRDGTCAGAFFGNGPNLGLLPEAGCPCMLTSWISRGPVVNQVCLPHWGCSVFWKTSRLML